MARRVATLSVIALLALDSVGAFIGSPALGSFLLSKSVPPLQQRSSRAHPFSVRAASSTAPESTVGIGPSPRCEKDGRRTCIVYTPEGYTDYPAALDFQKDLQRQRIDHKVAHKGKPPFSLPDALILVEHPEVYTLGSSSEASHILFPLDQSKVSEVGGSIAVKEDGEGGANFEVHRVQRGGKVTYHCPGQLVGYPIVDLARHEQDIDWYLRSIEGLLISVLARYGVQAGVIDGLTGVWVDGKKIAAVGVGASRWVTLHGWALNVDNDMQGFKRIVPCGIADRPVCCLRDFLGDACPSVAQVKKDLTEAFMEAFDLEALPAVSSLSL